MIIKKKTLDTISHFEYGNFQLLKRLKKCVFAKYTTLESSDETMIFFVLNIKYDWKIHTCQMIFKFIQSLFFNKNSQFFYA